MLCEKIKRKWAQDNLKRYLVYSIFITSIKCKSRKVYGILFPKTKYIRSVELGDITGTARKLFASLCIAFQCSDKPQVISYYISNEEHLWVVIDDMVEIFDPHREGFLKHHNCFVWMNKYCSGVELVVDG